ncbi:hypothetical protein AN218_06350 [Streptomyces nanshensis]|uniref:Uncharacterized protein n=1 Tax=Streptomyces nanshensis TaxID=518642 RepID=A0A1E7L9E1_9ACTN|nr:hypothetical protein AN218_06350 [Streptomyces nanshensis]
MRLSGRSDPALAQQDEPVAEPGRHGQVVDGDQNGLVGGGQHLHEFQLVSDVQVVERFVQQNSPGLLGQRTGYVGALLFSAGERPPCTGGETGQAHAFEGGVDHEAVPGVEAVPPVAEGRASQSDHVRDPQLSRGVGGLADEGDVLGDPARPERADVVPVVPDGAVRRLEQPRDAPQQR